MSSPPGTASGCWTPIGVMVETFSAELNLAQPQEIELYSGIFDSLAAAASYGRAARSIITHVVDDLAAEMPENGT
jgi:hypothetical protein